MRQKTINSLCDEPLLGQLAEAAQYGRSKLALAKEPRSFCIVVCGVFSSGKSSLINALLGTSLPVGIFPVTKVVTKIRYGICPRVVIHDCLSHEEWEVSQEEARAVIMNQKRDGQFRDCQIYVETPSEFLKDDIVIIDTPGMDDDKKEKLDEITRTEIRNADFCVINYMCTKFGQASEREFLEEMQELTHGNFVSVLNCLNYLQQGEEQLEDLEKRAKYILEPYGNERIGKGRYFRVDSKDRENAWLDGLDDWLKETIRTYRKILQADTPLTMAYTELRRAKKDCDARLSEMSVRIEELQSQNADGIKKQQRRIQMDKNLLRTRISSDAIREKDRLTVELTDKLRVELSRSHFRSGSARYCVNAKKLIETMALSFADEIQKRAEMKNKIHLDAVLECGLRDQFQECLSAFAVPQPTYTQHERGIFDPDRYLVGKTYRVYNDYVGETLKEVDSSLLPRLKLRIDQLYAAVESCVNAKSVETVMGGYEEELRGMEEYIDQLSKYSLDVLAVLHEVRTLRDELIKGC